MSFNPGHGGKLPRSASMNSALAIRDTLMTSFPDLMPEKPAKVVAREVGATPRAIKGQKEGDHLPSLPVAIALAQRYPHIREFLWRMMQAEMGNGEDPSKVLNDEYRRQLQVQHQLTASLSVGDDAK
jgi:hypothetical protein